MITDYTEICAVCGRKKQHTHHLIFGRALRDLADADGLTIPVCAKCHEMIHHDSTIGSFSKMIGQLAWEGKYMYDNYDERDTYIEAHREARMEFMKRYGRSYI